MKADHAKTIREALNGLMATHGEPCQDGSRCQAVLDGRAALKALSAIEEERRRLRWRWQFIEDHLQSLRFLSSGGIGLLWEPGELGQLIDDAVGEPPVNCKGMIDSSKPEDTGTPDDQIDPAVVEVLRNRFGAPALWKGDASGRGRWRVGSKVPLNVYEGDRPVCQCHSEDDARRIVNAMNHAGEPHEGG